jgi:hypothetical protein
MLRGWHLGPCIGDTDHRAVEGAGDGITNIRCPYHTVSH